MREIFINELGYNMYMVKMIINTIDKPISIGTYAKVYIPTTKSNFGREYQYL